MNYSDSPFFYFRVYTIYNPYYRTINLFKEVLQMKKAMIMVAMMAVLFAGKIPAQAATVYNTDQELFDYVTDEIKFEMNEEEDEGEIISSSRYVNKEARTAQFEAVYADGDHVYMTIINNRVLAIIETAEGTTDFEEYSLQEVYDNL